MRKKSKGLPALRMLAACLCLLLLAGTPVRAFASSLPERQGAAAAGEGGSASPDYAMELSCGFHGWYRDNSDVPVTVTVSGRGTPGGEGVLAAEVIVSHGTGSASVEGLLERLFPGVRAAEDPRNTVCTYRYPVTLSQGGSCTQTIHLALADGCAGTCRIRLETPGGDMLCSAELFLPARTRYGMQVYVGVLDRDGAVCDLDSQEFFGGRYELTAIMADREDIGAQMLEARVPDILVMLEEGREELRTEQQEALARWEADGGVLLDLSEDRTAAARFRARPEEYLAASVSERDLAHRIYARDSLTYREYSLSGLLEQTPISEAPSFAIYGLLLIFYVLLAGPVLYLLLKKFRKRTYLFAGMVGCALFFALLIDGFGSNTRLTAPVITYLEEIRQRGETLTEQVDFAIQAPYTEEYAFHADPSYLLTPQYPDGGYQKPDREETADTSSYETMTMVYDDARSAVTLSNLSAFAVNPFSMRRHSALEGEGLRASLRFTDRILQGTVENRTGCDLSQGLLLMPGWCLTLGDLPDGEELTVADARPVSVRDVRTWLIGEGYGEQETSYLSLTADSQLLGRRKDCLLIFRADRPTERLWLDSAYDCRGSSWYVLELEVDMTDADGVLFCPYAQEYMTRERGGENAYALPASQLLDAERTEFYCDLSGIFEEEGGGTVTALEFREPDVTGPYEEAFSGTVELYDYGHGAYVPLDDWKLELHGDDPLAGQYLEGMELRVRYTLAPGERELLQEAGGLAPPDLIVWAKREK